MDEGSPVFCVLGERGVGKSTLLATFISRKFITPGDTVLLDQRVPSAVPGSALSLHLIDSCSIEDNLLQNKVRFADVLLFCYDTGHLDTLTALASKWVPYAMCVENFTSKKIILVGLKADGDRVSEEETQLCTKLFLEYPFFLESVRCSARRLDVDKVFVRAELNYSYPIAPLYDIANRRFTPRCYQAFKRIFRILDADVDGLLSDAELNRLQETCFRGALSGEELQQLRKHVRSVAPLGVRDEKLTLDGLFAILSTFVDKLQTHNLWVVLRLYDYDDALDLELPDFELPQCAPSETLTLSGDARAFLTKMAGYVSASLDCPAGQLTREALQHVFSVVQEAAPVPWLEQSFPVFECENGATLVFRGVCGEAGLENVSLDDWVAQWGTYLAHCPRACLQLLYLLGYDDRADVGAAPATRLCAHASLWSLQQTSPTSQFLRVAVVAHSVDILAAVLSSLSIATPTLDETSIIGLASVLKVPSKRTDCIYVSYSQLVFKEGIDLSAYDIAILPYRNTVRGDFALVSEHVDGCLSASLPRVYLCVDSAESALDAILVEATRALQREEDDAVRAHTARRQLSPHTCVARLLDRGVDGLDASVQAVLVHPDQATPAAGKSSGLKLLAFAIGSIVVTSIVAAGVVYFLHSKSASSSAKKSTANLRVIASLKK